jgi:hypothetical protein
MQWVHDAAGREGSRRHSAAARLKGDLRLVASLRRLHWWELALAALPFVLAISQVGYFATKPFHATFGVILGLVVGTAGCAVNIKVAQRGWSVPLEVAAMIVVLLVCFVAVEAVALLLGVLLPVGFFDR